MSESRRLGRGLEALLGPVTRQDAEAQGTLQELAVGSIRPNPYQPRVRLDEPQFQELVASMEVAGLLQPVVVRRHLDGYQLIAGERRWRAAQKLGWAKIPAVIKEADDRTLLTLALVENLQRDNLSSIEEATSYQRLVDEFQVSHAEIARLVGRDRSTVANALRLLKLPGDVTTLVDEGRLSEGHARALLGLTDRGQITRLANDAVAHGWSVRDMETKVRGARPAGTRKAPVRQQAPAHRRIEDALRKRLGTDVRVTARRRGRGSVAISYYSEEDLVRVLEVILGEPFAG
jgi:ParB family transcriptional regulator, chromosome partitioning protein